MEISRVMIRNYLLFILFSVALTITIAPISAVTEFDAPPIDEAEKEVDDTEQIWVIAIVLVGIFIAIRIAFQIIKKRRQQSDED